MSKVLGTIITGVIVDENEKSVFVQKDSTSLTDWIKMNRKQHYNSGDTVKGFVYEGMNKQLRMTLKEPASQVGKYG